MANTKKRPPVRRKKKYKLKYKIRWKVMLPFIILVILAIYLIVSLIGFLFSSSRNQITICDFDKTETLEVMNNHYDASYEISDYLFYGEYLDLYTADYNASTQDALINQTIQLRNLCNGTTTDITLGEKLDQQINLASLDVGFYEVFLKDGAQLKRLTYDEVLAENSFSTIVRDKKVKRIEVLSNPEILNNDDAILDKNYFFLKITEEKPSKDDIDVFIDPYGNNTDYKDSVDAGQVYHNVSENKEIYKAAFQLKAELEDAGLRVMISRDSSDAQTTLFGENGRLIKAYNAHAKYYIKLGMNGSPLDYARGMELVYSAYSSNDMASKIYQELIDNTSLEGSTMRYPDEARPGLIQSLPIEGNDGQLLYDEYLYVREAGGKGTLAGRKDDKAVLNTFAVDNRYGMQAIELDYLYLSNTEDLNYWKENSEEIVTQTANALLKAWGITKE